MQTGCLQKTSDRYWTSYSSTCTKIEIRKISKTEEDSTLKEKKKSDKRKTPVKTKDYNPEDKWLGGPSAEDLAFLRGLIKSGKIKPKF